MIDDLATDDLTTYLDGSDTTAIAAAARRLDYRAYQAGQMSKATYHANIAKTDQQLHDERDGYRRQTIDNNIASLAPLAQAIFEEQQL